MSAIINASIDLSKVDKSRIFEKDGKKWLNLSISVNDETRYGNNVGIALSQSKEEREAKAEKVYLGNGKVVWSNEGDKPQQAPVSANQSFGSKQEEPTDDLPF